MSLSTDIISRTVRTQKLFNFQVGKCFYVNIEASKKNEKNEDEPIIKITNSVCKEVGSTLSKITEIRFKEKLIVIEDQYFFGGQPELHQSNRSGGSSQPTKSSDGSNHSNNPHSDQGKNGRSSHKKRLIFKKNFARTTKQMQKRNTKNVAKNFCNAFFTYLQKKQQEEIMRKAKQLMGNEHLSNSSIEAAGQDPKVKEHFIQFLKQKAGEWVQNSRVKDKKIHRQAIKVYLSLVNGNKFVDQDNQMLQSENGEGKSSENNQSYDSQEIFEEKDSSQFEKKQPVV